MISRLNRWPLLAAGLVLAVALLSATGYVWLIMPRYAELEQLEMTVKSEKQVLAALEKAVAPSPAQTAERIAALQKKVPVHPLTDQLLLLFQKAEYLADSRLVSAQFSDEDTAASQPNGSGTSEGNEGKQSVSPPSGIQSITAQLTVQSPSYYQLERFLEVLENADRILAVEGLTLTGPPELTSTSDQIEPLTYSVTIRAFYAPKLEKWKTLAPIYDVPPPSGKDNPLAEVAPATRP
ncbi:pilus assembly protein PilO [Caldibacillus thermoamylovorans]